MSNIPEQARKIAELILLNNQDSPENRKLHISWLKWIHNQDNKQDKPKLMRDYLLEFLDNSYHEEFKDVLGLCRVGDGFSLEHLIAVMDNDNGQKVVKKLGLNYEIKLSDEEIINKGLENNLAEFLLSRYGVDFNSIGDAVDIADLLHAAFFHRLSNVSDSLMVDRILGDYLSSKSHGSGVYNPTEVNIDLIMAFFESYEDKKAIEGILLDIEKRKITKKLADTTKAHSDNPEKYRTTLKSNLDDVISNLTIQRDNSNLDGSKHILNVLIERYSKLRDFKLDNISDELHGWAFPRFYQTEAVLDIFEHKKFLIADEMGTGKTAVSVLASEYIAQKTDNPDFRTLVITTNTNKGSFANKIKEYLNLSDEEAIHLIKSINGSNRTETYGRLNGTKYLIINYELLRAKDWKLDDYSSWEVTEERYEELGNELNAQYAQYRASGKTDVSKSQFILKKIPKHIRIRLADDDTRTITDAAIKIMDLNDSKSVVRNIRNNYDISHVIIDEIQNAKNSSSLNSKAIKGVAKNVEYITCLSGTPFVNGLSDLGILFDVIGIYDDMLNSLKNRVRKIEKKNGLEKNSDQIDKIPINDREQIIKYRKHISNLTNSIKKGSIEDILLTNPRAVRDYLKPKMLRRKSEDLLKIPPIKFHPDLYQNEATFEGALNLPMFQRMTYQILLSYDFHSASDQLRALQMALLSGGLYSERFKGMNTPNLPAVLKNHLTDEESTKYKALEHLISDIVSDSTKKKKNIVIFSSLYKTNVTKYLQERLSNICECLRIDGDVTNREARQEREEIIEKFNAAEEPTLLVATIPTMKEAIELHKKCSNVIFLDFPFTWAAYSQAFSRVWRADQDEPVDVYNQIVSNSLDFGKLELILEKRRLGELLLQGSPLNKEEIDVLNMTDSNSGAKGFLKRFVAQKTESSLKIMRDLYSAGKEKVINVLGERNIRSEAYANYYILNILSAVSLRSMFKDLVDLGVLNLDKKNDLNGRVLDLASGYGTFSHVTNIATENLEINPFMVERAKDYAPNANYTQGAMQDVNAIYGDNRFDAVLCSLAFHYASDSEKGKLLHDIHKTLADNGYLFITESYKSENSKKGSIDDGGVKELVQALEHTGFSVAKNSVDKFGDKRLFKIVAQKTGKTDLYEKPFALREFSGKKTDIDEFTFEEMSKMYELTEEDYAKAEEYDFGALFGPHFMHLVGGE